MELVKGAPGRAAGRGGFGGGLGNQTPPTDANQQCQDILGTLGTYLMVHWSGIECGESVLDMT